MFFFAGLELFYSVCLLIIYFRVVTFMLATIVYNTEGMVELVSLHFKNNDSAKAASRALNERHPKAKVLHTYV